MPPEQQEDNMRKPSEKRNRNNASGCEQDHAPDANAMTSLDPHEIMNASIEFQIAHNIPLSRRSDESQGSNRKSLYPSLTSIGQMEQAFDMDQRWENASRSAMMQRASTMIDSMIAESDSSLPFSAFPSTTVCASLPPESIRNDDDDLIAEKLAAYSGGNMVIPNSTSDDTIAAMKHAAYEGYWTGDDHSARTRFPEQQADVTSCIGYEANSTEVSCNLLRVEVAGPSAGTSVIEQPYDGATEAMVIGTGLIGIATAEAWSVAPATEATTLIHDDLPNDNWELDSKPPAREHGSCNNCGCDTPADATVIGYDVHPAELSIDAVQAEYVGNNYQSSMHLTGTHTDAFISAEASEVTDSSTSATYQINGAETVDDHITEVDVIESGPMEKATAEAWSASTSGEAHVLEELDANHVSPFDAKMPVNSIAEETWGTDAQHEVHGFPMTDGEAEVVGITEEVHPSELLEDATAQAELVGSDFNTAIAIPSNGQDDYEVNDNPGAIGHANILVETGYQNSTIPLPTLTQPQEAHATLINDSEHSHFEVHESVYTPVTSLIEPFTESGRSISDPLPATPVTVLPVDDSSPTMPPRVSFGDNIKQEPFSGRTASAPLPTAQVVDDTSNMYHSVSVLDDTQLDWERAPSFGGKDGVDVPAPIPPPVATATEVLQPVPPPIPTPNPMGQEPVFSQSRNRSINSTASDSSLPGLQMITCNIARGANNVMETLFGNAMPGSRRSHVPSSANLNNISGSVLPRTLLPSSVIFSAATNSWVATVNTNQKALEANNVEESSKALRAFSVPTQKQAIALARAWAPPKMHPFASNPNCFICESQFAVFRRACHCRNCGVCICGPCSVQWPAKMLPVTYNIKKESVVNICKACDYLCSEFRLALLRGDHDKAVALHSTGNINLTTPFANVKGELFYPVHCAVLGGSLTLLKWLVDEHCCPLRSIRISNGKAHGSGGSYTPILTSKGRSLLGIALGNRNIGIVRYLVVEKRMLLSGEKGLDVDTLTQNLDLVLRVLPEEVLVEQALCPNDRNSSLSSLGGPGNSMGFYETDSVEISAIAVAAASLDEEEAGATDNECIICCDNQINCVFTPCGHQICCIQCGNHISRCPVCAVDCTPMRVFKP